MPWRCSARSAWIAIGVVAIAREARAELPPIAYDAPADCPTASAFLVAVRTLPAIHPVTPAPRAVSARVAHVGARFVGALEVVDHDGEASTRKVAGEACEDVAETLLFLTALALGLSTADPPKLAPPPVIDARPPAPARDRVLSTVPHPLSKPEASRIGVHAGVDLVVSSLVAPNTVAAIAPYVAIELRRRTALSPELRLSFQHFSSPTIGAEIGFATVRLDTLALDACPVRVAIAALRALPCLAFQAGVIEGRGYGATIVDAHAETRPWLALAPSLRVEWTLFDRIELGAEIVAVIPLVEHSFYFGPSISIENIPVVGALGSLSVGARFR